MSVIKDAILDNTISGYSILDFDTQRESIKKRVSRVPIKPTDILYVKDRRNQKIWANREDFEPIFEKIITKHKHVKVFIATEVKAHEEYLKFCVEKNIDSLTEKPIFTPVKDNKFDPGVIDQKMREILKIAKNSTANHSVMTLGRYHSVYNDEIFNTVREIMLSHKAPLTSLHLMTNSGVSNLFAEYSSREDHPYKYGYGMLMHGAYHYVDLIAQFLDLNIPLFPKDTLSLTVSSFAAFPYDQDSRMSALHKDYFNDNPPTWATSKNPAHRYGETDITTTLCLKNEQSNKTITLGTICLEQTTPSVRNWIDFPDDFYNKNGRVSCTTIEAQLSTIFSVFGRAFKLPVSDEKKEITRVDNYAQIYKRSNAALIKEHDYVSSKTIKNYFNSDSNRKLLSKWLRGEEKISRLVDHEATMKIMQVIGLSIQKPGYPFKINYTNRVK